MRSIVALVSVAGVAADVREQWAQWKLDFNRMYGNEDESHRFDNFAENVARISAHNTNGSSFIMSTNKFSDLSPTEFRAQYLGYTRGMRSEVSLGRHEWQGELVPDSVDWAEAGAVTPIKDQKQCGSCWAFSTTGGLEGAFQLATGQLVSLSEQQLVDCNNLINRGCSGGSMDFGLRFAKDHDFCSEDSYPYEAQDGKCRSSGCSPAIHKHQVTGVKDLALIPELVPASQDSMHSALAQQPVSIAVDAGLLQSYSSGIIGYDCGTSLDHGVLAVGYGQLDDSDDGTKYWKVKNSWNSEWGMDGYFLLKRGGGGKGACGMLLNPVYPVVGGLDVSV